MKQDKIQSQVKFILKTNETLANAIRRSINEIPVVAIDEVEIHKNDSALYDEIIAHRLGLVPIRSNRKLEEVKNDEKASMKSELHLTLKAKGPCTVYSGDIKGDVEVIYPKMPLVFLEKDQEIEIVCFARLGKGKDHAKFSPGLAYYRNITEIHIKRAEVAEKIIEKLKDSLLNPPKGKIKSGEIYFCTQDMDYIDSLDGSEEKGIETKAGEDIVFFIESWGQIKPNEIFSDAVKALNKNLGEISKVVKK